MIKSPVNFSDVRLLMPEVNWLETEHFDQATAIANSYASSETQQWQAYLNALALLSLEEWFQERISAKTINRHTNAIAKAGILNVGGFKIAAIASEHLLDEVVNIPQEAVDNRELTAHFYVFLEVAEEEEQIRLRGFIRYDQLHDYCVSHHLSTSVDNYLTLPLSILDTEPNHLLFYTHYLEPSAIALPAPAQKISEYIQATTTKLSKWFEGVFDDTWQTIDTMLNFEANLAFSTRNVEVGTKRGKLIDLGMQLGNKTVALLVSITEETNDKLGVLIQLHPTGGERFLPANITVSLLSKAGVNLQQVQARNQDNYIQLKPFRGEAGKKFSIQVNLDNAIICEDFEL